MYFNIYLLLFIHYLKIGFGLSIILRLELALPGFIPFALIIKII